VRFILNCATNGDQKTGAGIKRGDKKDFRG